MADTANLVSVIDCKIDAFPQLGVITTNMGVIGVIYGVPAPPLFGLMGTVPHISG